MKTITREMLIQNVKEMFLNASVSLDSSMIQKLQDSFISETNTLGKSTLSQILLNQEIASKDQIPLCQDTGVAIVFLSIGNELYFDYNIDEAINEAVRLAYQEGYLRKSVVRHPLDRVNTSDNTPAIIHTSFHLGDTLDIQIAPKGAGSENMSRLAMLMPSEGMEGVKNFVKETVRLAGGKPCPPIILGVGIGGNFEKVAYIAKQALFRPINDEAENAIDRQLEKELLEEINELNIGPMGLGGKTTCLAVKVNSYPCHIASLPVAVNIQCHSNRKSKKVLKGE